MEQEATLLEAVALAGEILERGAQEGRGIRLASLVLKLDKSMQDGNIPLSWRPTAAPGKPSYYPPPPLRAPSTSKPSWEQQVLDALPDPEELDREWKHLCAPSIPAPPKIPSSFPKPRITLAPPEDQDDDIIELDDDDIIELDDDD